MSSTPLPLAEPNVLWRFCRRARLLRLVLVLALAGAAAAAFAVTTGRGSGSTALLGSSSRGVIVLDLSASVESATLRQMYGTLTRFAASGGRYGLVVFSDQAYEALPPGTPASQLRAYAQFFRPDRHGVYPTNPWAQGFSLGTQISTGLDLARTIVLSSHLRRRDVWLISDLGDKASDFPLVSSSVRAYDASRVALHVVAVNPVKQGAQFFAGLHVPKSSSTINPTQVTKRATHHHRRFPVALAVAAALLALLLAANELWSTPFDWEPARS